MSSLQRMTVSLTAIIRPCRLSTARNNKVSIAKTVIPAKAGIQENGLDARFHWDDDGKSDTHSGGAV